MTRDDSTPTVTRTPRAAMVSRTAMTLAAVALAASSLTACNKLSPQQTDASYAPADGVDLTLGNVDVRNLLIVAEDEGTPGRLGGLLVNNGQQDATVKLSIGDGTPVTAIVKPGAALNLEQEHLSLPAIPVKPGGMTNVLVATDGSGSQSPQVPVLAPLKDSPYATMTGSGESTATSTTTASPTAGTTPTADATTPAGETPTPAPTTTAG